MIKNKIQQVLSIFDARGGKQRKGEGEEQLSSYLSNEARKQFLGGGEAIKMDETGKVRTAKVIIGFVFGINLTPSQNLGKLFFLRIEE